MLGAARAQIEAQLTILRRSGGNDDLISRNAAQLAELNTLAQQALVADGPTLDAMWVQVSQAVTAVTAVSWSAPADEKHDAAVRALMSASEAAHREVNDLARDFYGRKIFEPYLRFASPEDEEAYRQREAEWERYIKQQQALGTPQGELNATNAMIAQMDDAGAHGADKSPEFKARRDTLLKARADLAQQIGASPSLDNGDVPAEPAAAKMGQSISEDAMASFRAAGITGGRSDNQGHGVATRSPRAPATRVP